MSGSSYERAYLGMVEEILGVEKTRMDRTGVGIKSVFGRTIRVDLQEGFPLLTTKQMRVKSALGELLWMLSGSGNIRDLLIKYNCHIWSEWPHQRYVESTGDAISIKEFEARVIDDKGFADQWGDTGGAYGVQWRAWEGEDGRKHDQIAEVIRLLREDPMSRRMMWTAWNVPKLGEMMLPPCHHTYQVYVDDWGKLSLLCSQRSCDTGLGFGFNALNCAALVHILCELTGYEPGEVIWNGGDCHVYLNHVDGLTEQLTREPYDLPTLNMRRGQTCLEDFRVEDFVFENYQHHPHIKLPIAV